MMKVLDLFSGLEGWSKPFKDKIETFLQAASKTMQHLKNAQKFHTT